MNDKHGWANFERLRRTLLILWAAWFPFVFVVGWMMRGRWHQVPPLLVVVIVVWTATVAAIGLRVGFWPCPRCGKPFFLSRWLQRTRGEECPHCKLPYGS